MAGSAAVNIWPSHWLLAFSIFLFFSLALVKRYGELVIMRRRMAKAPERVPTKSADGELLAAMGMASGYLAVLVLALYIATDKAQALYTSRELLWFLCPFLLYWISYVWLTAHRGQDARRSGGICHRRPDQPDSDCPDGGDRGRGAVMTPRFAPMLFSFARAYFVAGGRSAEDHRRFAAVPADNSVHVRAASPRWST